MLFLVWFPPVGDMAFDSITFVFFFLPIFLSLYFLIPERFRNPFLIGASLIFYAWEEGRYVLAIVFYMVFNYYFGVLIERYRFSAQEGANRKAKTIFVVSLAFNLGALIIFKYLSFIIANINSLIESTGYSLANLRIHPPIGMSFFAFMAVSYVVDVYRRNVKAQKSLATFSMYESLFPKLLAGPIVRYRDMASQVDHHPVTLEMFSQGVQRFMLGLGKKVLIANSVGVVADQIFRMPVAQLSFSLSWLGAICYTLQIYFDFSGYSDMAIGIGKMLGFEFLENFRYPYISKSVREFWRRWHISFSTWLRDYLYVPLGGNQKGAGRTFINLIIVFFLCGLWHGAKWTFVIWGLWHGLFLIVERTRLGRLLDSNKSLGHIYTLCVVSTGWVFFRSDSLSYAANYLCALIGLGKGVDSAFMFLDLKTSLAISLGMIGSTPVTEKIKVFLQRGEVSGPFFRAVVRCSSILSLIYVYAVFALSVIFVSIRTYNPFIYFQF